MGACNVAWSERISAWLDGEASAVEGAAVEAHLSQCPACAHAVAEWQQLGEALRGLPRELPQGLEQRAREAVVLRRRGPFTPRRRVLGAALGLVALLIGWAASSLIPAGLDQALAVEISAHHFRAFARARPCDFESDDPAEVEAWLERTFGYAVEVPHVPGAVLLGARKCRLHGVLTAALLYRIGDEALTIFLPQSDTPAAEQAEAFAAGGLRCTEGKLGETICSSAGPEGATLAVAAVDAEVLTTWMPR